MSVLLSNLTKFLTDITLELLHRHVSAFSKDYFENKACNTAVS